MFHFNKKRALLLEWLGLLFVLKDLIILVVIAYVGINFFALSINSTFILVGFETISTISQGIFKILKAKQIASLSDLPESKLFKSVMLQCEKYNLTHMIIALGLSIVSGIILNSQATDSSLMNTSTIPTSFEVSPMLILLTFAIPNVAGLIIKTVRVKFIDNIDESLHFKEIDRRIISFRQRMNLIQFALGLILLFATLYSLNIPEQTTLLLGGIYTILEI